MEIFSIIETEIQNYLQGSVPISKGYSFSQAKLVNRIVLYKNCIYQTGKTDSQGKYKYWFDIISPRIDSEVKNIDFDTKDIILYSDKRNDATAVFLTSARMKEWMRETGQAVKLNESVEDSTGWGNVVWKKIKDGYEKVDLKNFYVINQTAETLEETPAIERHILTQSDLRAKNDVWENVEEVIKNCGDKSFTTTEDTSSEAKQTPYYTIYERNGEVSEKTLKEAKGKEGGSEDKYVLAKIITAGVKKEKGEKYVLFAEEIKEMPYKEYHRGRYSGRWFRTGLYEVLFDIQTRANEIGNQISRGLEWASKTIFRSKDRLIVQNILTDMMSGDIIKADELSQVEVRMQGIDQLIADWNRLMDMANRLCNSFEVVTGESLPSGTPFRLGALMNVNANKLFDFIREKLSLAVQSIFQDWILPDLIKDLKAKDILRLTGNSDYLKRYYEMVVNSWYLRNLIALGPHSSEQAEMMKDLKLKEIQARPEALVKLSKKMFEGFKPRCQVIISAESVNLMAELETLYSFIQLEQDPIRRNYLLDMAYVRKGINIDSMPRTTEMPIEKPIKGKTSDRKTLMEKAI